MKYNIMNIKKHTRLPNEYQEVEYIESSGTQYIDTGIKNTAGDSYEIEFMPLVTNDTQRYFGGLATSTGIGLGLRNDGNLMTFAGSWIYPTDVKPTINQKIKVEYRSGYGWYLDNTLIDGDASSATETQNNICLCSVMYNRQTYYPASIKLYAYKHKNSDNTLLRDLVPCYRKSDDEPGMYDLVNDTFYTNVGTGTFNVGEDIIVDDEKVKFNIASYRNLNVRLPEEYQEVEYLESDGNQYINTGVYYNDLNDKFEIDLGMYYSEAPSDNQYIFGSPTATGRYLSPRIDKNKETMTAVTGGSSASLWVKDVNIPTGQKNDLKFIVNGKNLTINVNGVSSSSGTSSTPSSTGTIIIFDIGSSNNAFVGRIYYFKIFNQNNGELVRDLVPCYRKSDNEACMYDLVNDTVYTNLGTGDFTIGSKIVSKVSQLYNVIDTKIEEEE